MSTTTTSPGQYRGRLRLLVIVMVALALAVSGTMWALGSAAGNKRPTIPTSAAVENASGVRILRATLAADGGLIDVRYQVIDRSKAGKYMTDTNAPPAIDIDRNGATLNTVIAMQHRQDLRVGGTYFLIYHNASSAVRRGDLIDITVAGVTLNNVPVE